MFGKSVNTLVSCFWLCYMNGCLRSCNVRMQAWRELRVCVRRSAPKTFQTLSQLNKFARTRLDLAMSVYYHYTSHEGLTGILDAKVILPSLPHPATPGILAGESIVKSVGAVFLTRMDPSNSKESIAFNNYR